MKKTLIAVAAMLAMSCGAAIATDYYVDSEKGDDAADGATMETAWRTLGRVNNAKIAPGDRVLFKRGGLWRGSLRPSSGEEGRPVTYSWYGKGPKPILQQSVDKSRPSDWFEESPGIWSTVIAKPEMLEQIWDGASCEGWNSSWQNGVKGTLERVTEGETFLRATCTAKPISKSNLIQFWGPKFKGLPDGVILRLKVRSSMPFSIRHVEFILPRPPWTMAMLGELPRMTIGAEWQTVDVFISKSREVESPSLHMSIGDSLPEGAVFDFVPVGVWRAKYDPSAALCHDVGIFICDHGKRWGVKKWSNPDWKVDPLVNPLDYTYDSEKKRVLVRFDDNPAKTFSSIELAFTKHIVSQGGCHDVVYDGLSVRYGGAHGFGGGSTRNITIRNCDIYWIGGGLQAWSKDKKTGKIRKPIRYGNGIEFWAECHNNLVERNRLWQIYDAALTNQTKDDPRHETDVVWRDNVIWQAEYSFEYWNHDPSSATRNILFEHNTCIDAGYCWSHDQRPVPNGAHLMFYVNSAPTTNFVVRNNLFVRTTNRSVRFFNDWRVKDAAAKDGLEMSRNLYWIPENLVAEYQVSGKEVAEGRLVLKTPGKWGAGEEEFARYKSEFGLDVDSVWGEPQFVDEAKRDYRLKSGSPGKGAATDGTDIGARGIPGLDEDQSL